MITQYEDKLFHNGFYPYVEISHTEQCIRHEKLKEQAELLCDKAEERARHFDFAPAERLDLSVAKLWRAQDFDWLRAHGGLDPEWDRLTIRKLAIIDRARAIKREQASVGPPPPRHIVARDKEKRSRQWAYVRAHAILRRYFVMLRRAQGVSIRQIADELGTGYGRIYEVWYHDCEGWRTANGRNVRRK